MRGHTTLATSNALVLGNGHVESPLASVAPRSLYMAQLRDRPATVEAICTPDEASMAILDRLLASCAAAR